MGWLELRGSMSNGCANGRMAHAEVETKLAKINAVRFIWMLL
jgi:hypothetical protein